MWVTAVCSPTCSLHAIESCPPCMHTLLIVHCRFWSPLDSKESILAYEKRVRRWAKGPRIKNPRMHGPLSCRIHYRIRYAYSVNFL
ncbi:hypothetical protein BDV38DRAFT_238813 [Aspergillus pseudotamarii]|uniref:Uncharacterized protein n=1 Tax=Aspergillus pseudotamarii TaxID=132259 RepID=A0A5N6T4L7_ASPPS|nr:uncharacterized protein BDV38DRAFT_238813 [Aspergillus pseudotamarii]KAE8141151.1 hypothetical protein BDV38DRAFT_238813 [Aspergillus pseudotamarii]